MCVKWGSRVETLAVRSPAPSYHCYCVKEYPLSHSQRQRTWVSNCQLLKLAITSLVWKEAELLHEFDRLTELQLGSPQCTAEDLEQVSWRNSWVPFGESCQTGVDILVPSACCMCLCFFTSEREDCFPLGLSRYAEADCVDSLRVRTQM